MMFTTELKQTRDGELEYMCPGCGHTHRLLIKTLTDQPMPPVWTWNHDRSKPTFRPSVLYRLETSIKDKTIVCHSWVTEGQISFLGDCTHKLANKTIDVVWA